MIRTVVAVALFASGIVVGVSSSQILHAQAPTYATKEIIRTDLNNLPGQEAPIFASTGQPGFRLP